ncbi:hypothetical protein KKG71_06080 [Patescibacteria group bacterium]|nr:hypothetical protein [Patescibacteria group bacterium]
MIHKLKRNFLATSFDKKLILLGSLIAIFGTLLPWYADLDSRNIASKFYGISGPLYLLGGFILLGSIFAFYAEFSKLMGKRLLQSKKFSYVQGAIGLQSVFLVILAFSIYFHTKFGLGYVSTKAPLVGIYMTLIGSLTLSVGAYFKLKQPHVELSNYDVSHQEAPETADIIAPSFSPPSPVERERPAAAPVYRVEKSQVGFETRVKTVLNPSLHSDDQRDNNQY